MADDDKPISGHSEAHTAADFAGDAAEAARIGSTRAATKAAMADLQAQMAGPAEADQPSLLLDEIDEQQALFAGPVQHVAQTIKSARGRGRPKGSTNKANERFRDTLMRMGFRHPGLNLAAIANADPGELAKEMGCERMEAMAMVLKANAELLPYFESKAPTEIKVDKRIYGMMIVGELPSDQADDEGFISLTSNPIPDE